MAGKKSHQVVPVIVDNAPADIPLWQEALFGLEVLLLRAAPIYYGLGAPHGNGQGVIVIPGFLGTDLYLMEMYAWLRRMGYRPYFSGIGLNAECPNLLIRMRLNATLEKAKQETGGKVHLIGHSLGGIIARSLAGQRPNDVASVITLGAPFMGTVVHPRILKAAEMVRARILQQHGAGVLPDCYTGRCTCNFLEKLRECLPPRILQTAIYTQTDGIVDWRYCITGTEGVDFEVPGTHIGLAFNSSAYAIVANRLHEACAAAAANGKGKPGSRLRKAS